MMFSQEGASYREIIGRHTALVKRIAHHMMGKLPPTIQIDDLMQSGMIGLLEAFKNYNENKGASFETYAGIRIRGAMLDEIRKGDWTPRSVHRNMRRVAQAVRQIENETGRDAKASEVAETLNVDLEKYHQMMQDGKNAKVFAIEAMGTDEDALSEIVAETELNPLEGLQQEDLRKNLARNLSILPERERLVLTLYYDHELNLKEVGKKLGVSESRISQIHSQAMSRLSTRLKGNR